LAPAAQRPASVAQSSLTLECAGQRRALRAPPAAMRVLAHEGHHVRFEHDGVQGKAIAVQVGRTLHLHLNGDTFSFTEPSPYPDTATAADPRRVLAPVAGVVAQLSAQPGDTVQAGQPLVCVEAMKMEMWQYAAATGTVRAVHVAARDSVAAGALLIELETDAT
jgi:biotin carboxyl carrier protein